MDDPFRAGFEAGFRRGMRLGKLDVADRVQSALPRDSGFLGFTNTERVDSELTAELLEREARQRSRAQEQNLQRGARPIP